MVFVLITGNSSCDPSDVQEISTKKKSTNEHETLSKKQKCGKKCKLRGGAETLFFL